MHKNTKYWSLTWDTNVSQKQLPDKKKLGNFLQSLTEYYTFQSEKGTIKGNLHYQGAFTLLGPRLSKKQLLDQFKKAFDNVSGLTLKPVYDKVAIQAYVTKTEGRVDGPYYGGKNEMFDPKLSEIPLRPWQQELFDLITCEQQQPILRDRKVLFIQDTGGNTGKSWFQKWLRFGQKKLVARSLPVSSVDRLLSAVYIITRDTQVDLYNIDLTKTKGDDQSYEDLFSAIEQIKNGHTLDLMYGKYHEACFNPPMVIIYTNLKASDFIHYLSFDRWQVFEIKNNILTEAQKNADGRVRVYGPG